MKLLIAVVIAIINSVVSFRSCSLFMMAGGRSPTEKTLTKKGLFKELKQKLNTAAEIPGFFEVGDGKPVFLSSI